MTSRSGEERSEDLPAFAEGKGYLISLPDIRSRHPIDCDADSGALLCILPDAKCRRKKICRDTLRVRVYRGDEWLSEKPDQGCLPLQQDDPACDTDSCSGKPIRIIHAHSHGPDGQLLWRLPPALSAGGISLLFRLDSARLWDPFPPCTGDAGRMHRWLSQRGLLPPLGRYHMLRSRNSCPMMPTIPPEKGFLTVSKLIPVRQMASQHPYPAKERRMFCCSRTSWLCKAQLPCPQESLSQCY